MFEQPAQLRGIHIDADQLHEIHPGSSTRTDVTSLIGTPTAHASFNDNSWVYIGEKTRPRIGQVQGIENQDVVIIAFNNDGIVQSVRHLNQEDGKSVDMAEGATKSPGSSASFMQQLLGNVGRYNPGGLAGAAMNQHDNTSPSGR